ncbi:NYN domain-containing protein [Bradyrhizobium guangdongense]|uniref:LabA-like NYN domain-containing protein n=1 Tax=Bradyrhizobium guangdongense TaxID=1325090 RepID=UPI001FDA0898|nr:NYN domain-containing protein [Bradyrhizobium guangdongense]
MSPVPRKVALFIDGANLHATSKTLGFDIDYKRLLTEFQSRGPLVRAFYYTALIEDREFSSLRPLVDWLDYNGYTVVTKATEFVDSYGRRKVKGNMDIELAVDAMSLAEQIDEMVLLQREPAPFQMPGPTAIATCSWSLVQPGTVPAKDSVHTAGPDSVHYRRSVVTSRTAMPLPSERRQACEKCGQTCFEQPSACFWRSALDG